MSCPGGFPNEINGLCYSNCPTGYLELTNNPTICYDERACASQGIGLTQNTIDDSLCDKPAGTAIPDSGVCGVGQTQQGSLCQVRCPLSMTENSDTCIKRYFVRVGINPVCSGTKIWNGSACVASSSQGIPVWFMTVICVFLGLLLWLLHQIFLHTKYSA